MSFRIQERERGGATEWIAEWPFRARAHFIGSNAYETLRREMLRYVRGEVAGRCFLVAGHRGAGKTALVRQVVEDLRRSVIGEAVGAAQSEGAVADRRLERHRPLMVRLHGPSLLAGSTPAPNHGGERTDSAVVALEQITIGLYRALTAEFAEAFANHARERIRTTRGGDARNCLELGGQFTLELDSAPGPATLRALYARIGRLHEGVLWPVETSARLRAAGLDDQGIREIVALATAAQAFEVCAGEVKSTEIGRDVRSRETRAELRLDAGVKDLAKTLFGLGLGALVGLGIGEDLGGGVGAVAGAAAALSGALAFQWSGSRTAKSERSREYTFIRDRTKRTLERDLPLVIERVRDAGLAPVFVLDELDKLADPKKSIAELIGGLKHLTTDYGCFCFLTDRDYYQHVLEAVELRAFPVEHSFFSHRFFVLHRPPELLQFLSDIVRVDGAAASGDQQQVEEPIETRAGRLSLALFVLHCSKLNVIDLLRQIAALCEIDGQLRPTIDKLRSDRAYLMPAKVQLAIDTLLREERMRTRCEGDPRFMQYAVDALYMLSRAWESESASVDLGREALVHHLLERIGETGGEVELIGKGLSGVDLDILASAVCALGDMLSRSEAFRMRLEAQRDVRDADGERALEQILPPEPLLRRTTAGSEVYEFLFDTYGQDRQALKALRVSPPIAVEPAGPGAPASGGPTLPGLPPEVGDQAADAVNFLAAFDGVLQAIGVDLADLVSLQVLPTTIVPAELTLARRRLDLAQRGGPVGSVSKDLPMAVSAADLIRRHVVGLDRLIRLAIRVARDADVPTPIALRAIARFVDLGAAFAGTADETGLNALQGPALAGLPDLGQDTSWGPAPADAYALRAWGEKLGRLQADTSAREQWGTDDNWSAWRGRLSDYLSAGNPIVHPVSYSDIVSAAQGRLPGEALQRDLRQVSVADWSLLCLRSFPGADGAAKAVPAWIFPAALRALGFSRSVIEVALGAVPDAPANLRQAVLEQAPPEAPPGAFLIMRQGGPSVARGAGSAPLDQAGAPIVALPHGVGSEYNQALQWLREHGGVTRVVYEFEETKST